MTNSLGHDSDTGRKLLDPVAGTIRDHGEATRMGDPAMKEDSSRVLTRGRFRGGILGALAACLAAGLIAASPAVSFNAQCYWPTKTSAACTSSSPALTGSSGWTGFRAVQGQKVSNFSATAFVFQLWYSGSFSSPVKLPSPTTNYGAYPGPSTWGPYHVPCPSGVATCQTLILNQSGARFLTASSSPSFP